MRRRWDYFQARHPWRAALLTAAIFLPLWVWLALRGGWLMLPFFVGSCIMVLIEALSWGPEGERRRRFIRKYGALPEWREARWMREGSSLWPD